MKSTITILLLFSVTACGTGGSQYSTTKEISDKVIAAISGAKCNPESSGFAGGRDIRCYSPEGGAVNVILYSDSGQAKKAAESSKSIGAAFGYGEPHIGGNWLLMYQADSEAFAKKIIAAL